MTVAIKTFRHKGLEKYFNTGTKVGINPKFAFKIGLILDTLESAQEIRDVNFPGSDFHGLKGELKDMYSIHVNGNWVIIFKFINGDIFDVDLVDYH